MFHQHRGNFLYFLNSKFFFLRTPPPLLSFHSELSIQSGVVPGKPCKFYKEKCIHCALQKKLVPFTRGTLPPPLNYPNTIPIQEGDQLPLSPLFVRVTQSVLFLTKRPRGWLCHLIQHLFHLGFVGKIWKLLTFRGRYSHLAVKLVEIAWILQLAFLSSCFPFELIPQTQYKFFMLFNALSCVTLVLKNKMIEYEFYCAVEKISTRCNPKMYQRCFTSPWDWCRISTLSFLANTSATLSTNQMLDDNQLRLSYSHLPALQIRYSFW